MMTNGVIFLFLSFLVATSLLQQYGGHCMCLAEEPGTHGGMAMLSGERASVLAQDAGMCAALHYTVNKLGSRRT